MNMTTATPNEDQLDYRAKHTVCDALLWDYLQGKADPAEALLVATHYQLSPEARKRVTALNECAAVGLETAEPVAMKCSAHEFLKKCCAKEVKKEEACKENPADQPVPKPLQKHVGMCFNHIKWQNVLPGIAEKRLKLCGSAYKTKLMKIDNGISIPAHSHAGKEITLVLRGSFSDAGEVFKAGDVAFQKGDSADTHAPQALEQCVCLVVNEGSSRVPGILGVFINPILRLRGL